MLDAPAEWLLASAFIVMLAVGAWGWFERAHKTWHTKGDEEDTIA